MPGGFEPSPYEIARANAKKAAEEHIRIKRMYLDDLRKKAGHKEWPVDTIQFWLSM